ncbi:hypothetical protein GCM10029992_28150 [Glycomyces albus]
MDYISSREELRSIYRTPDPDNVAVRKELEQLDGHCRSFIARSPFVLIGSSDGEGNADVTPRGDRPGFVTVLDESTIAIPDRPGNNRLDTLENIVVNPAVGLLFLIPGMNETLRVNGEAKVTVDASLRERMAVKGSRRSACSSSACGPRICTAPRRSCAPNCGGPRTGRTETRCRRSVGCSVTSSPSTTRPSRPTGNSTGPIRRRSGKAATAGPIWIRNRFGRVIETHWGLGGAECSVTLLPSGRPAAGSGTTSAMGLRCGSEGDVFKR